MTAAGQISAAEAAGRSVYWQEGESFTAALQCVGSAISDKPPASGGRALAGNASKVKGSTVTYELDLPQSIADARIIFRYARLHWKASMVPARFTVEITSANDTTATADIVFPDTKGWGLKSSDWRLAAVKLGELKPGKATLKLTGQNDENDVVIDGFYIAPVDFAITADELALTRIVLTAQGYLGLKSATTIRQDLDKSLVVVTRGFGITPEIKSVSIGKTIDSATAIRTASTSLAPDVAQALTCELPDLDDGNYVFLVEDAAPSAKLTVPVILAGQFLAASTRRSRPWNHSPPTSPRPKNRAIPSVSPNSSMPPTTSNPTPNNCLPTPLPPPTPSNKASPPRKASPSPPPWSMASAERCSSTKKPCRTQGRQGSVRRSQRRLPPRLSLRRLRRAPRLPRRGSPPTTIKRPKSR